MTAVIEEFFPGPVPVLGMIWVPDSYKGADLLVAEGREYLRTGKFVPYAAKYSALIGSGLDQYVGAISAVWNFKVLVNGVYEWWLKTQGSFAPAMSDHSNFYRQDANGMLQLVCAEPDYNQMLLKEGYALYRYSTLGVLNGGKRFVRNILGVSGSTYKHFLFWSDDGFTWQFKQWFNGVSTQFLGVSAIDFYRATSTDDFYVVAIFDGGYGIAVFDKNLNQVAYVTQAATTIDGGLLVGPDGVLFNDNTVSGNAYFLNFANFTCDLIVGGNLGMNGRDSDVNETSWAVGGNAGGSFYCKPVGGLVASFATTNNYWGCQSAEGPYKVRWYPGGYWVGTGEVTGNGPPNISYKDGAEIVAATTFTAQASSAPTIQCDPTVLAPLGRLTNIIYYYTTPALAKVKQSGAATALTVSTNGWMQVIAYISGTYYAYCISGTRLWIFSSTDLRTWTWLSETTVVNNVITIFKVVNGVLFVSDGTSVWTTTDGITLTSRTHNLTNVYDVTFQGSTYCLIGANATGTHSTSTDLSSWTKRRCGTGTIGYRGATDGTTIIITTNDATSKIYYSTDGGVTPVSVAYTTKSVINVVWDGSKFVAVDGSTLSNAQSTTGQSGWTTNTTKTLGAYGSSSVTNQAAPPCLAYKNGTYYLGITSPAVALKSTDLLNWSAVAGISLLAYTGSVTDNPSRIISAANSRVFAAPAQGQYDLTTACITELNPATPGMIGTSIPATVNGASGFVRIK